MTGGPSAGARTDATTVSTVRIATGDEGGEAEPPLGLGNGAGAATEVGVSTPELVATSGNNGDVGATSEAI